MLAEIRIRDATENDIPSIARIYAYEVEHGIATFEEVPPTDAEMKNRMAAIDERGLPYLVAEHQGEILGYCHATPFHTRTAYRFTVEDTIYMDRGARGRGVGRGLLAALIERTEALGCRQMMGLITQVDDSASIALHEKLGFRPVGIARAVGFKFGRWTDVVYMQRPLGSGDARLPDRPAPALSIVE
jgi:phosphinothricin acetyltransferase